TGLDAYCTSRRLRRASELPVSPCGGCPRCLCCLDARREARDYARAARAPRRDADDWTFAARPPPRSAPVGRRPTAGRDACAAIGRGAQDRVDLLVAARARP